MLIRWLPWRTAIPTSSSHQWHQQGSRFRVACDLCRSWIREPFGLDPLYAKPSDGNTLFVDYFHVRACNERYSCFALQRRLGSVFETHRTPNIHRRGTYRRVFQDLRMNYFSSVSQSVFICKRVTHILILLYIPSGDNGHVPSTCSFHSRSQTPLLWPAVSILQSYPLAPNFPLRYSFPLNYDLYGVSQHGWIPTSNSCDNLDIVCCRYDFHCRCIFHHA